MLLHLWMIRIRAKYWIRTWFYWYPKYLLFKRKYDRNQIIKALDASLDNAT